MKSVLLSLSICLPASLFYFLLGWFTGYRKFSANVSSSTFSQLVSTFLENPLSILFEMFGSGFLGAVLVVFVIQLGRLRNQDTPTNHL